MTRFYFDPDLLTFINKAWPSDVAHFFRNPYIANNRKLSEAELIDLACTIKRPGMAPSVIYAGVLPKFEDMGDTSPTVADEFVREGAHLRALLGSEAEVQRLLAARRNGEKTPKQDAIVMKNPIAKQPPKRQGPAPAVPEDVQVPESTLDGTAKDQLKLALGKFDGFAAIAVSKAGDTFHSKNRTYPRGGAMIGMESLSGPDFAQEVAAKLDQDGIFPKKKGYYIILPGKGAYEVNTKNGMSVQPIELSPKLMERKRAEQMRLLIHYAERTKNDGAVEFLVDQSPKAAGTQHTYHDVRTALAIERDGDGPSWLLQYPHLIEKLASVSPPRQAWSANIMEAMNHWDTSSVCRFFQKPELYAHDLNVEQRQFVATKLTNPDLAEVVVEAGTLPTPEQLRHADSLVAQAFAVQRGMLLAQYGTVDRVEAVLAHRRDVADEEPTVEASLPEVPHVPANIVDLSDRETTRVASKR